MFSIAVVGPNKVEIVEFRNRFRETMMLLSKQKCLFYVMPPTVN